MILLQVWIDLAPILDCWDNTHLDNLVTKSAEVLVRLNESSVLLLGTVNRKTLNTICGLHKKLVYINGEFLYHTKATVR